MRAHPCNCCGGPVGDGVGICLACKEAVSRNAARAQKAVATRRRNDPGRYRPEHADDRWKTMSHAFVALAKRLGVLPLLDGSIACVDCERPAKVYEHRDYSKPMDVEPVCISCNFARGTAKWPAAGDYSFKRIEQG